MANSVTRRDRYMEEAESCHGGLAYVSASLGNEYGYSYYWWYYAVPTTGCHALEKRS
jgi:hypothetical protein